MDKKPLIGVSICAVVLLVLGSLSNVVGYQTGNSLDQNIVISKSHVDDIIIQGTMGENGWYTSTVQITFVSDNYTYFRIDYGNWTPYTFPIIIGNDGIHLFEATSDFEHIYNVTIKIDQTIPALFIFTMSRAGIFKWKLSANVSDETSGINRVEFYFNDNFVNTSFAPGPYIVYWRGSMILLRWIGLLFYHIPFLLFYFFVQPQCIVYDNAGNFVISPSITN